MNLHNLHAVLRISRVFVSVSHKTSLENLMARLR